MKVKHQSGNNSIDIHLTKKILRNYKNGRYNNIESIQAAGLPSVDGKTILDMKTVVLTLPTDTAENNIRKLKIDIDLEYSGKCSGSYISFFKADLERIGVLLYPLVSCGILNGGSATSYIDVKKNKVFNPTLFEICHKEFKTITEVSKGRAKGITPSYVNEDGTAGASFIELKMRSLLIQNLRYKIITGKSKDAVYPLFQMTSVYNNEEIEATYKLYKTSPLLKELITETGFDITKVKTGVQSLIAAFTHSSEGREKKIFQTAYGQKSQMLPLPGGHGQNFIVLRDTYEDLFKKGKRFVTIGNVDNLGYTVDPVSLAILALSGKQAGFDFAYKTPADVKGGVLLIDKTGRLNCGDIGPAISPEKIKKAEKTGDKILFNCATGLFNLEYLVNNIDYIINSLPVRFSDQDKDAGRYSQAEQVTWEIIGILNDFYIFCIDKYDRFLPAKLLLDTLITSGIGFDNPMFPCDPAPEKDMKTVAFNLNKGLIKKLSTDYGMKLENHRWVPKSITELRRKINNDNSSIKLQ